MILKKEESSYRAFPSIIEALGLEDRRDVRLCAAGAGGKTTLLKRLAAEYKERGIPVAVTTTTRMYAEEEPRFLLEPSPVKMGEILEREGVVFLGRKDRDGKMKAPEKEWMKDILALPFPVLVEADGSRRLPLKAPGEREPVFPEETTHVVYVYGMGALGRSLGEVCFRPERVAAILGRSVEGLVREEDIALLAGHPLGGRKGVREAWHFTVALTQADLPGGLEAARRISRMTETEVLILGQMKENGDRRA